MDDRLRSTLTGLLKPAFDEVNRVILVSFPGINVGTSVWVRDLTPYRLQSTATFDARNDEHEAVVVTFECRVTSPWPNYPVADPGDEMLLLEVETGRGAPITMLGPAFPGLVPADHYDAFVETFAARAAEHLGDSIPVILRALERSEFRPSDHGDQ